MAKASVSSQNYMEVRNPGSKGGWGKGRLVHRKHCKEKSGLQHQKLSMANTISTVPISAAATAAASFL